MIEQITDREIGRVVDELIRRQLDDSNIISVDIRRDVDSDGDPILLVKVVFESETGKLDSNKKTGLLRHLLPKLSASGINMFPVMSFVSQNDANGVAA